MQVRILPGARTREGYVKGQSFPSHFRLPFLLNTTALAKRIRNVQLRLLPPDELIYREISKYDERSLLEALYNCIAHQDYTRNSRIIVTEHADRIVFESVGEFFGRRSVKRSPSSRRQPRSRTS